MFVARSGVKHPLFFPNPNIVSAVAVVDVDSRMRRGTLFIPVYVAYLQK
jgi:hypothetical protein